MTSIPCPQCERDVPAETITAGEACGFCGFAASESSTNTAARDPASPREEVSISLAQGLLRFIVSSLVMTTILAGLMAGTLGIIGLCVAIGRNVPAGQMLQDLPIKVLWFFGFTWLLFALITFPISFFGCLFGRSRTIWVEGRELHIRKGRKVEKFDLDRCDWYSGSATDSGGLYVGSVKPRLGVRQHKQCVSLGFTEEAAAAWIEYFESTGVNRHPQIPWRYSIIGVATAVIGGAIGLLLERLMPWIGGPAILPGSLIFIGVTDGILLTIFYLVVRYRPSEVSRRVGILMLALTYWGIAVRWSGVWEIGIANGVIGLILGWLFLPVQWADDDPE